MKRFEVRVIENFGTTWAIGINFFRLDFRAGLAYNSYNLALSCGKRAIILTFKRPLRLEQL